MLDYNSPCQKDSGFFFMPVSVATDLISTEKCSDMDCVLDLWLNTIYNDEQVKGSDIGPVVYLRNGTGNPMLGDAENPAPEETLHPDSEDDFPGEYDPNLESAEAETQESIEDTIWHEIHNAYRTRKMLTGTLGGIEQTDNGKTIVIVEYKGFRILSVKRESLEDISITADAKSVSENQTYENLKKCRVQSKYSGKVTDVRRGGGYHHENY